MTSSSTDPLEYRRLRAPRGDRTSLALPPFTEVGNLVADNQRRLSEIRFDFDGRSHRDLATTARAHLVAAAERYTRSYRDVTLPEDASEVFLSGHQPEMFHPGVWFKNFALGELASLAGAVPVHLLIDNDTVGTPALRVPGGTPEQPGWSNLAFDQRGPEIPYEERAILDPALLESFSARVCEEMQHLVPDPLIKTYWPLVLEQAQSTDRLGLCLSQARHRVEERWGLQTLEVPQSVVCQSEPFLWFVAHLLTHLEAFRTTYNQAVHSYRAHHNIRSANHPVPDLHADDEWLEAPFWIWHQDDPRRRGLYVRRQQGELLLTDRTAWQLRIPTTDSPSGSLASVQLGEQLQQQGVRLRTRALSTTLWARLMLGDLFLHGIGGAKYDQLTDSLLHEFYGVEPPGFLTLSATLHLPIEHPSAPAADTGKLEQTLWALQHHPEEFLSPADANEQERRNETTSLDWQHAQQLAEEKERWVAAENGRERCHAIRHVNEQLQPFVQAQREQVEAALEARRQWERAEAIRNWREYAFCLYKAETLRGFMLAIQPTSLYFEQKRT